MAVTCLVRMLDDPARNRRAREVVSVRAGVGLQRGTLEVHPQYMIVEISNGNFSEMRRWCAPEPDTSQPPTGIDEDTGELEYPMLYRRRIWCKFSEMGPVGQAAADAAYTGDLPFTVDKTQAKVFMKRRKTDEDAEGLD